MLTRRIAGKITNFLPNHKKTAQNLGNNGQKNCCLPLSSYLSAAI